MFNTHEIRRGSFVLSRLANYYPGLLTKLIFLDVGYSPPGQGLTEEMVRFVNSMVKENMGYEVFGYFLFFKENDAAKLMGENVSFDGLWICWLIIETDELYID